MSLQISGKHMNVGESLTQRIEDRIDDAVSKYFQGGFTGNVTIEKTSGGFECDCMIHLDSNIHLQSTASGNDATTCFEMAADKIEKRLRRYKRRLKDHHGRSSKSERNDAAYAVVELPSQEEEIPEDFSPTIIAESSKSVQELSVAEAVMQLDLTDNPVVVFSNAGNGKTNVVYRRSDGNIGWIDPK